MKFLDALAALVRLFLPSPARPAPKTKPAPRPRPVPGLQRDHFLITRANGAGSECFYCRARGADLLKPCTMPC